MYHDKQPQVRHFHAVTHTLLNDNEVKLLFEEAVKKYGDLTKLDLEENLAEDFRQYIQYEQDPNIYYRKLEDQTNQDVQQYTEIMFHYLQKTQFKNLTQEEQEFITSRQISEKEYNDLTLEEREHLLFCR